MGDFLHYIFDNFRRARQDHSQAVEEDEVYGGHRRDGKGLLFPRSTEPFKRGRRRFAEAITEITARETIKKPIKRRQRLRIAVLVRCSFPTGCLAWIRTMTK